MIIQDQLQGPYSAALCGGLLATVLDDQTQRRALAATFAPLSRPLCRRALGGASSSLCLRYWGLVGDGVQFRLRVAHGLRQHGAKLILGGRLRLRGCAHRPNVRRTNLNLKAAGLPSSLHHEFSAVRLGLPRAYPQRRLYPR
jgi:hypothetical protein